MILKEYRKHFNNQLSDVYPQTEIDSFFFLLIEEFLEFQRIDVSLKPDFKILEEKTTQLNFAVKRLQKEEPIQYILGKTEFYGLPFIVNEHVLIPRPETEELVEWILSEVKKFQLDVISSEVEKSLNILDIGTGSGCIPISLKKNLTKAEVNAIDISKEAIRVAKQNAKLNEVQITFLEHDILILKDLGQQFDVIVSNPPYVRDLEKHEIKNNVLENEPHLALFVKDNNPLLFYDKIADLAKTHLKSNGMLFFEINQYLGKETVDLLKRKGFENIELKKDLFGNDRMILAARS
tara:strand:+ start:46997 stop:47875 length:879 start_codon:yes stop_codon:yes gene_type:complete